ncbi:MAG TPA: hypothetical protein VNF68_14435 [Candidatus Baltobacteraceae bacterium]|nr:hypothetical protein [Candidatus Baltobacteraceae bacterium]
MPSELHANRRVGDRRQVERRYRNDASAYAVERRTSERRSGEDRRRIRNHDLAP